VASPELANAQRQPIQVSSEPAQIGQVKPETGRNLPGKRQPDEAIQSRKRPRDSLRDLTSMGGPMQGDRQVVDFGDGHGSSLATDGAIRRQRHENGAALSRLAELERVRVAWVGIPLRVARDVIVPEEGVIQSRLHELGGLEWRVGLLAGLLPREGRALRRVRDGNVRPATSRAEA